MSFPPEFLDEIRNRIRVSEIAGRHMKLTRQGGGFKALCPFHDDSRPSLNIIDGKNFYHCFACGANGDIITLEMHLEGLGFVDAVTRLAEMAGLDLPYQSPEAREKAVRQAGLYDVMEAACRFFEKTLRDPADRAGLDYLEGRRVSDETIARFRLGYAPSRQGLMRQALAAEGIEPAQLRDAGLVRMPEDGSGSYDYFRGRVIFPITDRRGRVIAFGGRVLGDRQPKYLNSPDTPLFHKGRVLYGVAQAREAATQAGRLIVTEGYMDVIALAQNGLRHVVAPLGTALTTDQIAGLWQLAQEPVICFDGDEAGRRAAIRAAERALPILKPGYSLQFVSLPTGEDPDDVMAQGGIAAMRDILATATGLADFLWNFEHGAQPVDTPERRAEFSRRIRARVREIADRNVQEAYQDTMEGRLWETRTAGRYGRRRNSERAAGGAAPQTAPRSSAAVRARVAYILPRRQETCAVAAFLNHPQLLDEFGEALVSLEFGDPFLDKLRQDILDKAFSQPGLDAAALRTHLTEFGYSEDCDGILAPETLRHAAFARAGASLEDAHAGVCELLARIRRHHLEKELSDAEEAFNAVGSEVNWQRVLALAESLRAVNAGAPSGDIE